MSIFAPYRKSIVTFLGTFFGTLGASMSDGDLTSVEVMVVTGVTLSATFMAYQIPNKPAAPLEVAIVEPEPVEDDDDFVDDEELDPEEVEVQVDKG